MEHEITQWLLSWRNGDQTALEKLTPLVYQELHRLAKAYMRGERAGIRCKQRLSSMKPVSVELRFFGGLTEQEIAEVLQVSPRTVNADWSMASVLAAQ